MIILPQALRFSAGTLLSRLTGLAREIVLARSLGAGALLDAFYVAFRIPHLLRDMLAEGALGSSFTKNYAALSHSSPSSAHSLALQLLSLTFCVTSLLCALGILLRKELVYLMTSHTPENYQTFLHTAETLTALFLPFMVLSSCGALISGMLYQKQRFFFSSCSPVLLNLGTICGAWLLPSLAHSLLSYTSLSLDSMVFSLALGTLAGGFLQLIWLWLPIRSSMGRAFRSSSFFRGWHPRLSQVCRESLPMMLAAGLAQLQLIINTNFATSLPSGSTSWLSLAFRMFQLPVGLFAVAIATTLLPSLSVSLATQNPSEKNGELCRSLQWTLWMMSCCAVVVFLQAHGIIYILFHGGSFDLSDVRSTALALQAYAPGIIGYGASKVLLSYYYAAGRTAATLRISAGCLLLSVVGNFMFIGLFAHIALAAVASMVMIIHACGLGWGAFRDPALHGARQLLFTAVAALCVATGTILLGSYLLTPLAHSSKAFAVAELTVVGGGAVVIFGICAMAFHRTSPRRLYLRVKRSLASSR